MWSPTTREKSLSIVKNSTFNFHKGPIIMGACAFESLVNQDIIQETHL